MDKQHVKYLPVAFGAVAFTLGVGFAIGHMSRDKLVEKMKTHIVESEKQLERARKETTSLRESRDKSIITIGADGSRVIQKDVTKRQQETRIEWRERIVYRDRVVEVEKRVEFPVPGPNREARLSRYSLALSKDVLSRDGYGATAGARLGNLPLFLEAGAEYRDGRFAPSLGVRYEF